MLGLVGSSRSKPRPATGFVAAETGVLRALQPARHIPPLFPDPGGQPRGLVLAQRSALFLLVLGFPGNSVLRQA